MGMILAQRSKSQGCQWLAVWSGTSGLTSLTCYLARKHQKDPS